MLPAHRSVARGVLVGVGLLVAMGAGAPAALADDAPVPDATAPQTDPQVVAPAPAKPLNATPAPAVATPDEFGGFFGTGKQSSVQIAVQSQGDVPADLDRSGATLTLTGGPSNRVTATCTTDASGVCTVSVTTGAWVTDGLNLQLPEGSYTVRQTDASAGLQADRTHYWTTSLCTVTQVSFPGAPDGPPMVFPVPCSAGGTGAVPDTSLFRRHLTATVVGAGAPLAGATYALAGPDYPHVPAVRGADGIHRDTATTGTDGVLSYAGWFMPGQWTLTPATVPDGYDKGSPATVAVPETVPDTDTASGADIVLTPPGAGGDPVTGTEGTGDPGTPPPAPVPAPPVQVPPAVHPSDGGTPRPPAAPTIILPQLPVLVPASPPAPATTGQTPPVSGPETGPSDVVAGPQVPSPRLAPASSSYVEVGVIGLGILLVAVAVIGVGVLRRRARG